MNIISQSRKEAINPQRFANKPAQYPTNSKPKKTPTSCFSRFRSNFFCSSSALRVFLGAGVTCSCGGGGRIDCSRLGGSFVDRGSIDWSSDCGTVCVFIAACICLNPTASAFSLRAFSLFARSTTKASALRRTTCARSFSFSSNSPPFSLTSISRSAPGL
jgi:hypothetical protein